jgi:hypothetical protein
VLLAAISPAGANGMSDRILRGGLPRMLVVGAVGVGGWMLVFGGFYLAGTVDTFYYAAFTYNQAYSESALLNILATLYGTTAQPYYTALGFICLLLHMQRSGHPHHALLLLMYLGVLLMVAAPGNFFPHYVQLLLPLLSISAGVFLTTVLPWKRQIPAVLVLLAPVWISFGYATSPERVAFVKYGRAGHGGMPMQPSRLARS